MLAAVFQRLRRYYPVLAFLAGFIWDALTIGQRVKPIDFWRLGVFLGASALLIVWMARRSPVIPVLEAEAGSMTQKFLRMLQPLPYLLLQFFFGGLFSALFILYFKSSGHLGSWLTAAILAGLLVANEFARDRYARRLSLTWAMFALNAILLSNFALPYALGSLDARWFYVSTLFGALITHMLWRFGARQRGRVIVVWGLAAVLIVIWQLGMIAPVPLVRKDVAIGHDFVQASGRYQLQVEKPAFWALWRDQSDVLMVAEGEKLYGVSAVFSPQGISAVLEHRWEYRDDLGWQLAYRNRFQATGGREAGFRGYSWVLNPRPGHWRFVVATEDGRTVAVNAFQVTRGAVVPENLELRVF